MNIKWDYRLLELAYRLYRNGSAIIVSLKSCVILQHKESV